MKAQLRLLNKAGAQRMLTQKLVKLLMMKRYEVGNRKTLEEEINTTVDEFEGTMEFLKKFEFNDLMIEEQLAKVERAWERFLSSITQSGFDQMIEINGEVLIEMDKTVCLYENLFRSQRITNAYAG